MLTSLDWIGDDRVDVQLGLIESLNDEDDEDGDINPYDLIEEDREQP